ncbi:MAG: SPOR domain-containing protein [Thermaurantimonas sp.]
MKKILLALIITLGISHVVNAQIDEETSESMRQMFQNYRRKFENKSRVTGYRIQLFTGNKQMADKIRSQYVQLNLSHPVYMVFEMPNYKIQVGDFRNRLEAEGVRESLMNTFSGAFLVRSQITPNLTTANN